MRCFHKLTETKRARETLELADSLASLSANAAISVALGTRVKKCGFQTLYQKLLFLAKA